MTFASGGVIMSNGTATFTGKLNAATINITGSAIKAGQVIAQTGQAMRKLNGTFELMEKEINYCNHRRGGPRSKVFCEVPKDVPHEIHSGRPTTNSGRWYSWKDREWD